MPELVEVASGLAFPEGPIAMPDGSVVLVEMFGPRLTRVQPDGSKETIAEIPGGPNGAALGPDGQFYVCNNGGRFTETDMGGLTFPGGMTPANYIGGRIQTVDPATGTVTDLYTECDGRPLLAPNDLVFDAHGGFYFTDHGLVDDEARIHHIAGIYYAQADGSAIEEVVYPSDDPNGIGLSPGRLEALLGRDVARPHPAARRRRAGRARRARRSSTRRSASTGSPGLQLLDSLAVDCAGQRVRGDDRQRRRLGVSPRAASSSTSSRPAT